VVVPDLGAVLSGCFDGYSLPPFVHFAARDCKALVRFNSLF
jgi:hypothetical protein